MTRAPFIALVTLAACRGDEPAPTGPTFYADAEPILVEKCASCHHPGGVGPGDWTDPDTASASAFAIGAWVEAGLMPMAAADPECRDYQGSHRLHLTDEERDTLVAWADAGGPLGDPDTRTPGLEPPDLSLDGADTVLPMPEEHTLDVGSDQNEYWCMVLDNPFTEPTWITGFDVELGNRAVVHHMLLVVDLRGNAGVEYGTDGTQRSFACDSQVVESDWLPLHAWTPGMEPVELPEGHGLRVDPGDQLVLQMHYFADPDAGPQTDQSAYRLRTASSAETEVSMNALGPTRFEIPAGEAAYTASDSDTNGMQPFRILGAFPHMHLLGRSMRAFVTDKETGEESCIIDGAYDFEHQMTYMFTEAAEVGSRDTITVECTWDNSAGNPYQYNSPPQDVSYGEGTNEEMCFLLYYYSSGD